MTDEGEQKKDLLKTSQQSIDGSLPWLDYSREHWTVPCPYCNARVHNEAASFVDHWQSSESCNGPKQVLPSTLSGVDDYEWARVVDACANQSDTDPEDVFDNMGRTSKPDRMADSSNRSGVRIPSENKTGTVPRSDPPTYEEPLDAGDLVYLRIDHADEQLGAFHPFRDSFTILLGNGVCPELEETLVGQYVGATGQIEVSTETGNVRMPLRPRDRIEPSWLAELVENAGIDTVREFVNAPGDRLTHGELLDVEQLAAKQTELEPAIEGWEVFTYEVVDAVRWREHDRITNNRL